MSAIQPSLFEFMPVPLDRVEAYVRSILESRKRANASGQLGEDVEHLRAAYMQHVADAVTRASCAEEGRSNVKFHVVERRHGRWVAVCGTGSDGMVLMSGQTVPAHSVPAHCRCRKSLCQRRFYGAEQDVSAPAPEAAQPMVPNTTLERLVDAYGRACVEHSHRASSISEEAKYRAYAALMDHARQRGSLAAPAGDEWNAEADRLKKCVDYATSGQEEYAFRAQLSVHLRQRVQPAPSASTAPAKDQQKGGA